MHSFQMNNREWKINECINFFMELAVLLSDYYEVIGSCNQDISSYLIPKGTESDISYYGKPDRSFRISDHWNWYANLKKCDKPNYIQCLSVDLPWAKKRPNNGMASKPVKGIQVSLIGSDGKYHAVFGEVFDRKTKKWSWLNPKPEQIANDILAAII